MNNDLISRSKLKEEINSQIEQATKVGIRVDADYLWSLLNYAIDNAPTVEPFEPDYVGAERFEARQRGYEEGYRNGMAIGKTLNPKIKQGEWIDHWDKGYVECPFCHKQITGGDLNFCVKCGADLRKGGAE